MFGKMIGGVALALLCAGCASGGQLHVDDAKAVESFGRWQRTCLNGLPEGQPRMCTYVDNFGDRIFAVKNKFAGLHTSYEIAMAYAQERHRTGGDVSPIVTSLNGMQSQFSVAYADAEPPRLNVIRVFKHPDRSQTLVLVGAVTAAEGGPALLARMKSVEEFLGAVAVSTEVPR